MIADFGRRFIVAATPAEPLAAIRRGKRDDIVVGDQVQCTRHGDETVIEAVAPRDRLLYRSVATRTKLLAANLDQLAIVYAAQPSFDQRFIWRALIAAAAADVAPLVVMNKRDQPDPERRAARMLEQAQGLGVATAVVSVKHDPDEARALLLERLRGRVTLLAGQSGMGKSSIVNLLLPGARERTQEFSLRLNLGRQTTTASRWFDLPGGGALIDAPGFQRFGLAHVDPRKLLEWMPDLAPLDGHCRFDDCRHDAEPGCAILAAVAAGAIDAGRHAFYRELAAECSQ